MVPGHRDPFERTARHVIVLVPETDARDRYSEAGRVD